jgi:digeranylgeranylglycerophospholipid reductase
MKNYDVIIIGAGFAGLSVAANLSDSKLNVLLVEKNKKPGLSENPVRGTFRETIKKYKLEKSLIRCYKKVYFYGTESRAEININSKVCLFDSSRMLDILKKRIKCSVIVNCEIVNVKRKNDALVLIDNNKKEYSAKLVVDASGRGSVAAQSLGVEKSRTHCSCYIAMLDNCRLDPAVGYYFVSNKISTAAAWLEPLSGSKCQIGIADFIPYALPTKEDMRRRLINLMHNFKPAKDLIGNAKILKNTEKKITYPAGPVSKMALDNLIVIGDAAGQATPFLGEGVRICLKMSDAAADLIKKAFKKQDFSEGFLDKYGKIWWNKFGKYAVWDILLRHFTANNFKDREWNITVKNLNALAKKEKDKFIKSQLDYSIVRKLLSFEITKNVSEGIIAKHFKNINLLRKKYFVSHFV